MLADMPSNEVGSMIRSDPRGILGQIYKPAWSVWSEMRIYGGIYDSSESDDKR